MKIGTATRHAMITAGCIAQHANEGSVKSTFISEEHGIPHDYLQKILQRMVKANILRSKKGPKGGFTLARPAKEITLLEIIEVESGPMTRQLELAEMTNNAHFSVEMEKVFMKASEKAASILSRAKLSQMVG
jgi:Rrf2 family protein